MIKYPTMHEINILASIFGKQSSTSGMACERFKLSILLNRVDSRTK